MLPDQLYSLPDTQNDPRLTSKVKQESLAAECSNSGELHRQPRRINAVGKVYHGIARSASGAHLACLTSTDPCVLHHWHELSRLWSFLRHNMPAIDRVQREATMVAPLRGPRHRGSRSCP